MPVQPLSQAETTTYAILFHLFCIFCHSRHSLPENTCNVHQRQLKVALSLDRALGGQEPGTPWWPRAPSEQWANWAPRSRCRQGSIHKINLNEDGWAILWPPLGAAGV